MTSDEANRSAIQTFIASKQGRGLERYLKESAWTEDINGGTKVYLVKDRKTEVIVFFFALTAGLLYKALGDDDYTLTVKEREIVNLCIEYRLDSSNEYTEEDVFEWYDGESLDKDRLLRIIEEKINIKLAAQADQNQAENDMNIMRVQETFPSIVLTHFCKNKEYLLPDELSFPLGFYVFWEIITDTVLHIASLLGCQYLYLFAADNTASTIVTESLNNYIYADIYDELDNTTPTYKLVEYYKNELKFEDIQGVSILKPFYDFECVSLTQLIHNLSNNKAAAWIQHSDID